MKTVLQKLTLSFSSIQVSSFIEPVSSLASFSW